MSHDVGNLHLNVVCKAFDKKTEGLLEPWIFSKLQEMKGSISAEHGIGQAKAPYLHYSKSAASIDVMRRLKNALDPHHIMNPGKVLTSD